MQQSPISLFDKHQIISQIPLFSSLKPRPISLILEKSEIVEYKKSDLIYKEGDSPSAFYCMITGRVQLFTYDPLGDETTLEYIHRGKYFGIISLLTNEPHSVSARAMNDSVLLIIRKADFDFILEKIPHLAIDLSRTLSRRLKRKDIHQKTIFESTVVSVFSSYAQAGKTIYSLNLSLSLGEQTHKKVILLDICPTDKIHSCPSKLEVGTDYKIFDLSRPNTNIAKIGEFKLTSSFGIDLICLHYDDTESYGVKRLVDILSLLINDYHYIILDLPAIIDQFVLSVLRQSDVVHLLTGPDEIDLERTHSLIKRLESDFNVEVDNVRVVINEYKFSKLTHDEQVDILNHSVSATLPHIELVSSDRPIIDAKNSEYAKVIRRISRELGECTVGLALGIGVGYGFCHIGVLKVIEEEAIPIDVISGSSIGAFIAALWATGRNASEILKITNDFKEPKFFWSLMDFTIPLHGFIKGNKLYKFVKKHLGNKTFQDVKIPLKIVASNVKKKEPIILDKGSLAAAVMASCTMPGVFRPFRFGADLLFDGGVTNPLPTEPLLNLGVKKIIAVNVTPTREDILRQYAKIKEGRDEVIKKRWRFSLKAYFRNLFRENILDCIFSSVEILQSELAQKEARFADIVLHPDTSGLYWMELDKAEQFARRGEEEARHHLPQILQLVKE